MLKQLLHRPYKLYLFKRIYMASRTNFQPSTTCLMQLLKRLTFHERKSKFSTTGTKLMPFNNN